MNITKISKTGHSTLRLSCFNVDSGIMSSEYSQIGKKIKPVLQQNFNLYLKTAGSSVCQIACANRCFDPYPFEKSSLRGIIFIK
jgi:hypothetical protein